MDFDDYSEILTDKYTTEKSILCDNLLNEEIK